MLIQRLFSKKKKDKEDSSKKMKRAGGALAVGGLVGNTILGEKATKGIYGNDGEVYEKLKSVGESKGAKVLTNGTTPVGPAYAKNTVYMNGSRRAATLAHELGHRHYDVEKNAGKIGKAAHKVYIKGGGILQPTLGSLTAGVTAGTISGKKKARAEAEGKKESKLNKIAAVAAPLAVAAPCLISEGLASRQGMKLLKKANVGKKNLRHARKDLATAWGTYGSIAAMNAGVGELSRGVAYKKEKKRLSKKED